MSYSSEVLADSPLAYWRLGESSGTVATDSANGRNGSYMGGPTLGVTGLLVGDSDLATSFDAVNDYVDVPYATWMINSAFTVEAVIKPSAVNGNRTIICRHRTTGGTQFILRIEAGVLKFYIRNGAGSYVVATASGSIAAGSTYHVAGTYDGTTLRVYVNGSQAGTATTTGLVAATSPIQIGASTANNDGFTEAFSGVIDEPAYYGTALSAARIARHYAVSAGAYPTAVLSDFPLIWLRLGEASGTVAADASGNGRNGTYTAAPTLGVPGAIVGDANTAATFNGSTQSVEVPFDAGMSTSTVSVEAWFKLTASGSQQIGGRWDSAAFERQVIFIDMVAGQIRAFIRNVNVNHVITAPDTGLRNDAWHHVVATYNGADLVLYVDGVAVATGNHPGTLYAGTSQPFHIGLRSGTGRFNGSLDEPALYGTALSAARVLAHYNAGKGAPSTPTATAALSGAGAFTAAAVVVGVAAASLTGAGSFTADARAIASAAAPLEGEGAFFATAVPQNGIPATGAALTGSGEFSATALEVATGPASTTAILTGFGEFSAVVGETTSPPGTDVTNRANGITLGGYGVLEFEPAVVEPPAFPLMRYDVEVAEAFEVSVAAGRPVRIPLGAATADRWRDRIVVGGNDITYLRGVPTPTPSFRLVSPGTYGDGSLTLPQVYPAFETVGTGATSWLRKGAVVKVQRISPSGERVTDYRGFVRDWDATGNDLVVLLAGELVGSAELDYVPPAVVTPRVLEAGRLVSRYMRRYTKGVVKPHLGPVTGIKLERVGDKSGHDVMTEYAALMQQRDGTQWTYGHRANGTWGIFPKDRTTIACTVYLDDARMKANVSSSLADEPTTVYASAVARDGRRVTNLAAPNLKQGRAARYPYANEAATFGEGTTNEDTDYPNQGLISAMIFRLDSTGLLAREDAVGIEWDGPVTRAVKRLQRRAGLNDTGVMNLRTWEALWDVGVTGFSTNGLRILPQVEDPTVRRFLYSGSGAQMRKNPDYDPHKRIVAQSIALGRVRDEDQAEAFAATRLHDGEAAWTGTLDCNMAVIRGEHNPGDPLPKSKVMSPRDIRPGMNVWAPTWQGGTLFHVSGVSVAEGGRGVQLAIDTKARDTMAVWEIRRHNREAARNADRQWKNPHVSSKVTPDSGWWERWAGKVDSRVELKGGQWTTFEVTAGPEGTLRSVHINLATPTRFAVMVFGRPVDAKALEARRSEPLSEAGTAKLDKPAFDKWAQGRWLIYTAGGHEQACGYFPGRETKSTDEGVVSSGDPLTGKWRDDAGVPFAAQGCVFTVAIWVAQDSAVKPGRMFRNQWHGLT